MKSTAEAMNSFWRRMTPFLWMPCFLFLFFQRQDEADFAGKRSRMVRDQIAARGIHDSGVLKAMEKIPRHLFVPEKYRQEAYEDYPLPIGGGQTISQPYIVALMTECLALKPEDKVLEIGTGSGYQAAILACIAADVYSLEIDPVLADRAAQTLQGLKADNVRIRCADGYFGWKERSPFDAVIVTCASKSIPPPLLEQLKEGGRLIIPLESLPGVQTLTLILKRGGDHLVREILDVRFVPMTGEVEKDSR